MTDVEALPTSPPPPPMDWMVKPGELTPEVLMGASLSAEISDPLTSVPSADALPTSRNPQQLLRGHRRPQYFAAQFQGCRLPEWK